MAVSPRRVIRGPRPRTSDGGARAWRRRRHKIVCECSLPLTGRGVVQRIITDLAVIDIAEGALVLRELAPGVSVDDIRAAVEPPLTVGDDLVEM